MNKQKNATGQLVQKMGMETNGRTDTTDFITFLDNFGGR